VNDERRPVKSAAAITYPHCTSLAERIAMRELDDDLLLNVVRGLNQVDRAVDRRREAARRAA
jgi:hypothetical protein